MLRFILFFTFHFSLFTILGQDVSFFKENITMKIEKDYFYVTGNYYLRTGGDKSIALVYPFPVDSLSGDVDSIYIFNLTANVTIEPLSIRKGVLAFRADFDENDEIVILISYRQKLLCGRAEYILESTIGWRKPFDRADYQLIVPAGLKMLNFSIPPDESMDSDDETIYYWTRTNYMPSVNMVFEFSNNQ